MRLAKAGAFGARQPHRGQRPDAARGSESLGTSRESGDLDYGLNTGGATPPGRRRPPMAEPWPREFARRLGRYRGALEHGSGIAVSIKLRVAGGCFHREHSPRAYEFIDVALRKPRLRGQSIEWHEHETGPEILVWLPLVTAGVAFSAAVVNLVVSVLRARSDGAKKGDKPKAPLELVVRTTHLPGGAVVEEKVLTCNVDEEVRTTVIRAALETAGQKLLPKAPSPKRKGKRTPRRRSR